MTRILGVDSYGRPNPQLLHSMGYEFSCRYYSWTPDKNLTLAEANAQHAAGIATVGNWETTATSELGGAAAGTQEGAEAGRQARACGQPAGRPIYYSADFGAFGGQLNEIEAYLRAAEQASGYPAGSYGSYATINAAHSIGITWLWQAAAWSSGLVHPNAIAYQPINQQGNIHIEAGCTCDVDWAFVDDIGQWGVTPLPVVSVVIPPVFPASVHHVYPPIGAMEMPAVPFDCTLDASGKTYNGIPLPAGCTKVVGASVDLKSFTAASPTWDQPAYAFPAVLDPANPGAIVVYGVPGKFYTGHAICA